MTVLGIAMTAPRRPNTKSATGKRFLWAHPHATLLAKVTSRAGHGKVTTTTTVHLGQAPKLPTPKGK
ncbi:MAG: hypothetical protein WAN22_30430 [Solirubrobacteraceae bacterium]